VVGRADEDVVDVEQDAAIRLLGDGGKELPFRHRRVPEGDVARDVLEQDAAPEPILDLPDATDDMVDRLVGVGERQQIVRVAMAVAAPAQVIRDPGRLDARDQLAELAQILAVERIGRADREGDAVQDHRGIRAHALKHGERAATAHHVVLRDDLEPVGALAVEHSGIVLGAEADAVPQLLAVRKHRDAGPGARPGPISSQLMILPCFCSPSAFGTTTIPFPLQAFWPAQLPPAPAQAPLPLHSLMPVHFTLSPPALSSARAFTAPLAKRVAAAVAMRIPLLTRFIDFSFLSRSRGGRPGRAIVALAA